MELSARDQAGLYLFERDAFFVPPRPRNQHILDILPQCPVVLEVDYRRRLAAFRIIHPQNALSALISAVSALLSSRILLFCTNFMLPSTVPLPWRAAQRIWP